ncbi:glutathione S-transferase family protein [Phenylobacterium sp.]|uniref:glutathione S-transferase family protein n=1 Tax=Phenylobacterium sp. TaxID=1871053 RepID=UPI0035ADCE3B
MTPLVIHTHPLSPYGWGARLICAEKGVPHTLQPVWDASAPEHRKLHPFGKVPVLQHGEVIIYESLAIAHYVARAFEGPALEPIDYLGQAHMLRWMSIVNGYCFPTMNGLIKERLADMIRGTPPDPAVLAACRQAMGEQLALIEEALSAHPFLVGEHLTLADPFLLPHLHFAAQTPEGADALAQAPATQAWLERMRARPSFAATSPSA